MPRRCVTLLALAVVAAAPTAVAQEAPDLVLLDGVVRTMDPSRPLVEALAVADGWIVAVGTSAEIRRLAGPDTEVLDAAGRAVIPGLIDAHGHVMGLGRALRVLDLVGTASPEEVGEKVRAAAAERPAGEWITGRGWDQNDWPEDRRTFPDHEILDAAAPDHPVYLTRIDGHAGWANARALDLGMVTRATPDPAGGRILRDADGNPTGVLIDNAQILVARHVPPPSAAEREAQLAAAQERMVEVGLTGVHDMGVNQSSANLYRAWAREGRLLPRIVAYLGSDRETLDWWDAARTTAASAEETGRFRVVGVKLYADGALGSRGAALLEPYSDDPGNAGLLVVHPDTLTARVATVLGLGLQPVIHAIGDRGNRIALDAIEGAADRARGYGGRDGPPPRIEHAQVVAPGDFDRFAVLGVVASVQPTHATSDMYWAEDRIGPDRIEGAYAWRTLRAAGARLACGSDFPVENANPFHGLYAAVARRDLEGWPEGGWRPEEAMTRDEALACFTRDAAAAAGMEDEVGSLAVGKRADFLILDADPLTVPETEIGRIGVERTVIGGTTAFRREGDR